MAKKIDGKLVISTLEFAAKAAEEFLKAYNQLKVELDQIRPLTPYALKKKKKEEQAQQILIRIKQHQENRIQRDREKIQETMRTKGLTWEGAVSLISEERSQASKRAWETRRKNA